MAFRKTLAQRLFHITKTSSHSSISSSLSQQPYSAKTIFRKDFRSGSSDSSDDGFFRRFLQKRAIVQSAVASPELRSLSLGDKLREKLKGINTSKDRLRLEGLIPPVTRSDSLEKISIEDTRKLLRMSQLQMLKTKLRSIPKSCISHSEFIQICSDGCSSYDQALEFAKVLDQSGDVIVLGNIVYLQPEQVAKAMEAMIPLSIAHPNEKKELEEMEKVKAVIDKTAEALVRRELQAGLGFLLVQTAAFMRFTFWELSWDVMEPICFFVTSVYFIAGYSFYLRTSRDPTFEALYQSRFRSKQKRLMKNRNFDIERFNELRRACYPFSSEQPPSTSSSLNYSDKTFIGAALHH